MVWRLARWVLRPTNQPPKQPIIITAYHSSASAHLEAVEAVIYLNRKKTTTKNNYLDIAVALDVAAMSSALRCLTGLGLV